MEKIKQPPPPHQLILIMLAALDKWTEYMYGKKYQHFIDMTYIYTKTQGRA